MIKRIGAACAAAVLFPAMALAAEIGDDVGKAGAVTPSATAKLKTDKAPRDLARDVAVKFGETLATTAKGNAGIIFEDQTRLFVAENSQIEIDDYVFGGESRLDLTIARGVLRLASGRIGGRNISVRTPVAYIGFRGTVISLSTDANTTVLYVEDGAVDAVVGQQTITVNEGQSLTINRDDPGAVDGGWPGSLGTAVASMTAQLATVAPVSLAVPSEIAGKLNAAAVDSAAQSTPSDDSGFSYN